VASKLSEEARYALTFRLQVLHHDYSALYRLHAQLKI